MKRIYMILSLLLLTAAFSVITSSCSVKITDDGNRSIVMVKNEQLKSYGTGFAVGYDNKKAVIVTTCSTIATANGSVPQTAKIKLRDSENDTTAYVIDYDIENNIALMRLSEDNDYIKPLHLLSEQAVNENTNVSVYGYSGTGNLMSDFEKFSSLDINRYNGTIIGTSDYNNHTVYLYSNEFNRALSGGPAVDEYGSVAGMCAYAFRSENADFSQYIIPSGLIAECLNKSGVEYTTAEEESIKRITVIVWAAEALIFAITAALFIVYILKKQKQKPEPKPEEKRRTRIFLTVLSGTLKGKRYEITDKLLIGRDYTKCGVVYPLNEPGVSTVHCILDIDENGYCGLTDNNSRYGVYFYEEIGKPAASRLESGRRYILKHTTLFSVADAKNMIEVKYVTEENVQ